MGGKVDEVYFGTLGRSLAESQKIIILNNSISRLGTFLNIQIIELWAAKWGTFNPVYVL